MTDVFSLMTEWIFPVIQLADLVSLSRGTAAWRVRNVCGSLAVRHRPQHY
jgi:hypothetical protein